MCPQGTFHIFQLDLGDERYVTEDTSPRKLWT
jgi:hypothetical protein